jgi:phage-related protein
LGLAMWEVEFFSLPRGRCPVDEFLSTLNKKTDMPYIVRYFSLLEKYGHKLRRPHVEYLRDKIYELRVRTMNGNIRLLYFFVEKNKIIITNGFKKKRGPVSKRYINTAIKYREMYLERDK